MLRNMRNGILVSWLMLALACSKVPDSALAPVVQQSKRTNPTTPEGNGAIVHSDGMSSEQPKEAKQSPEVNQARRDAWEIALFVVKKLDGLEKKGTGTQAWLKDFHKLAQAIDGKESPDRWPTVEIDALASRNPNFWRAYYEFAPGDPGLMLLHPSLLLSAGEATRASHFVYLAHQRAGAPRELWPRFQTLFEHTEKVVEKHRALVAEAVKLREDGDYEQALKKLQEVVALWPQNALAHHEIGTTLFIKSVVKQGEKVSEIEAVARSKGKKTLPEVMTAFRRARQHDPFQVGGAHEGDDAIAGLALGLEAGPAWRKLMKDAQGGGR